MLSPQLKCLWLGLGASTGGDQRQLGTQTQVNLALNALKIAKGLDLQLRLVNLFDSKIVYPASDVSAVPTLPTGGRQWQLGLSYAF